MKKIGIILACVIVTIMAILTPIVASNDNVTAEATDSVVVLAATKSTEATTDKQESKTTTKSSTSTTEPQQKIVKVEPYKMYIKIKIAHIHSKPNSKSKTVAKYKKGKKVTVNAKCGNWRRIGKNKWVHKSKLTKKRPFKTYKGVRLYPYKAYNITSNKLTAPKGVNFYNGNRETWYSQKVLPGSGLKIPGRHVAKDGTIRDKDGYICVAAAPSYKSHGSRLMTSLGPAKVYDCGCAYGTIDIYVNW